MSKPYKLYGASELESIQQTITEKVNRWLSEWSSNDGELESVEISTENGQFTSDTSLYSANYECDDSSLSIAIDEFIYLGFPAVLLPVGSLAKSAHSSLVKDILNRALYDLIKPFLNKLSDVKSEQTPLDADVVANLDVAKASGDIFIKLSFTQGCVYVRLPYDVVEQINTFTPNDLQTKAVLKSRSECSISGQLKLDVNVGDADIDFGSVVGMRVGDVIRLDSKISDAMTVITEDGDFVCSATLGKQGQNKAIKVII